MHINQVCREGFGAPGPRDRRPEKRQVSGFRGVNIPSMDCEKSQDGNPLPALTLSPVSCDQRRW